MQLTWKKSWQILFVIVLLGAVLRFYDLGNNSFVADEFLDMNSSYGYFKTGEWKAWDFNFGKPAEMNVNDARDERAFVYKWQVAQLYRFLPPTESAVRSISVLWGLFTVVLMFWVGYFYTRKKTVGLLAAFFFAVSISAIIFDRRLRMYAMFAPVYLSFATTLFALFESAYKGKSPFIKKIWDQYGLNLLYLLPFLFLGALSFSVHGLSVTVIPLFGLYLLIQAFLLWKRGKGLNNKYAILSGLGIVFGLLFLFLFPSIARIIFGGLVWFDNHYSYVGYLLRDFAHPLLGILLVFFGSFVLAKQIGRPKEALWLTLGFSVPLAMAVWFWRRNAGPQYIFFASTFVLLLASVGVYGILNFVREHLALLGKRRVMIALILLLLLLPNYGYFLEENNTYHETSSGGNPNYRKVFDYFKKNKSNGEVLITRNFRNYYFSGAKVQVYDFGGELSKSKFSLAELQSILAKHEHGWMILSTNDYDYISNEAETFFKKNMERVSNAQVRGAVEVYRW